MKTKLIGSENESNCLRKTKWFGLEKQNWRLYLWLKEKAVLNSYCLVPTLVKFAERVEKVENNSYKSVLVDRQVRVSLGNHSMFVYSTNPPSPYMSPHNSWELFICKVFWFLLVPFQKISQVLRSHQSLLILPPHVLNLSKTSVNLQTCRFVSCLVSIVRIASSTFFKYFLTSPLSTSSAFGSGRRVLNSLCWHMLSKLLVYVIPLIISLLCSRNTSSFLRFCSLENSR